ncbi:MAG: hypothetical protein WB682_02970 [Candidatus Dormiibacterota bacterium]
MSVQDPTPEGARSALTEVELRRAAVNASDRLFQPALIVLAGLWVAGMALIVVMPSRGIPGWVGPIEGIAVEGLLGGGLVAFLLLLGRQRARSRTGSVIFGASIAAWLFLNSWVHVLGSNAGWYLPGDPLRGPHFVLTAVIAVAPLLVGALVVGRRR